jgi:hypothetical protein
MNLLENMNNALSYIEENLIHGVDFKEAARQLRHLFLHTERYPFPSFLSAILQQTFSLF